MTFSSLSCVNVNEFEQNKFVIQFGSIFTNYLHCLTCVSEVSVRCL
jgi:hypothetical protein